MGNIELRQDLQIPLYSIHFNDDGAAVYVYRNGEAKKNYTSLDQVDIWW